MGKASRRRRVQGSEAGGGPGPTARAALSGTTVRARASRPTKHPDVAARLTSALRNWEIDLAIIAALFWLLGHVPGIGADLAIPAWIVAGLALGLLSPWFGLLLTLVTIPFLGGATDPTTGELLRVLPIHGAAIRILVDRYLVGPSTGRSIRRGPPTWVVACAAGAAILYAVTAQTGAAAVGGSPKFFDSGIHWILGGPIAMMSAWIAASHLIAGKEDVFIDVVLGVLVVACGAALLAYVGLPGIDLLTFPGIINNRLAALGYPTPTAMGVAVSLPFAVAAAWRRTRWLALLVTVLAVAVLVLTVSRGPIVAIAVGIIAAVLAGGRIDRRLVIPGILIAIVAMIAFVALRYGTSLDAIVASFNAAMGSDVDRVNTWAAAVAIAIGSPIVGGGWRSIERVGTFAQHQVSYAHNVILHGFAEGGLPLGLTNGAVIVYSAFMVWKGRHTMALYLVAATVIFFVCGFWDIPQVRSYAAVMGGIAMGMAAGPLIARRAATSVGTVT